MQELTQYKDIVSAFESLIKCKYQLSESLVEQWFKNALGQFELDLEYLGYNYETKQFIRPYNDSESFDGNGYLKPGVIITLAEMMKSYYLEQEVRRVNQLNNIIGKDISLNGTGDTKKYTKEEADANAEKIAYQCIKQKPSALV